MTVYKLLKKYKAIAKTHELVIVSMVLNDLREVFLHQKLQRTAKHLR